MGFRHGGAACLGIILLLPGAAGAAVLCPAERGGRALTGVTLFDGPPAEMASQVPEQTGQRDRWDVAALRATGRVPHLRCAYAGEARATEMAIPAGVAACATTRAAGNRRFGAVECR